MAGHDFDFTGVSFDSGDPSEAVLSGGSVSFSEAVFCGGSVNFSDAEFSGAAVSFEQAGFTCGLALGCVGQGCN
ncbi:hypothetical protein [Streptomyces justiciae]|uniref:hypothetical protein n=1 Tax=Streptomyces justiciae TaxID=2780140 RepID=UPI001882B778|nr:hypothetical protein [Streptomyces justiciae]MBE8475605.1 hypothetical protein [Streptomyces justiciae]MCW8382527.1 hypothetical protein [Streptomyces justiciae]